MKNSILIGTSLFLFALIAFSSCEKNNGPKYSDPDIQLIINTSCASDLCHSNQTQIGGLDCSSYAGMKTVLDNGTFNQRVLVLQNMPPNGTLPPEDIAKLEAWRDNGFAE